MNTSGEHLFCIGKTFNTLASMLLVVKFSWGAVMRLKFMLQMSMVAHVCDPNIYAAETGR